MAPCRCGESKVVMKCWERKGLEVDGGGEAVVLCERVCKAMRK